MIAPTWRGPPCPTYSAICPYAITRPGGIRSTAASTASTYASSTDGSVDGLVRLDLAHPGDDATGDVDRVVEASVLEHLEGVGRTNARAAVEDKRAVTG